MIPTERRTNLRFGEQTFQFLRAFYFLSYDYVNTWLHEDYLPKGGGVEWRDIYFSKVLLNFIFTYNFTFKLVETNAKFYIIFIMSNAVLVKKIFSNFTCLNNTKKYILKNTTRMINSNQNFNYRIYANRIYVLNTGIRRIKKLCIHLCKWRCTRTHYF